MQKVVQKVYKCGGWGSLRAHEVLKSDTKSNSGHGVCDAESLSTHLQVDDVSHVFPHGMSAHVWV